MSGTRIGVLSDTHMPAELRLLWDEVRVAFAGVDLILHSGDIVHPIVLDQLEAWAPVVAALGNNDFCSKDPRVAATQWLDIEGFRIAMVHDMEPEDEPIDELCRRYLRGERPDVMVTGHTHYERLDFRDGVLQVNSGSPVHPHLWSTRLGTVAVLDLAPGSLRARITRLGETDGRRNPGVEFTFDGHTVVRLDSA
ncbi:MAG: YfcE family phosphodiesterase [Actinobacteria bacterium]|nr:MAG: YfcE family phosphodiesterase [Actinomycetota bacterium]